VKKILLLIVSHLFIAIFGFAMGLYTLPILTAPDAPDIKALSMGEQQVLFEGRFQPDLKDSDFLHKGDGVLKAGSKRVVFEGQISPGPDYILYLSPEMVETKVDFLRLGVDMVQVGAVKTFDNFVVEMPAHINPADYKAAIVWCESFGVFITAGAYQ
jgi:hypothetical protein